MGFLGPVGIKIPLVVDHAVAAMPSVVVGGNAVDVHLKGVVPGRDFPLDRVLDLRNAVAGDPCPRCGRPMAVNQGIEVGHVFKLGTKYSKAMGATFLDDKGHESRVIMGCYGIGVNRIVAAAVEAGHDDNGIIWPLPLAPYEVLIVPLQVQNAAVMRGGRGARASSSRRPGVDVLIDDREQRPGVKFKDADLIGIPLRVVVGERGLEGGDDRGQVADRRRRPPRRGGDGRRGDPGRGRGHPQGPRSTSASSAGSPARAARGRA